MLHTSARWNRGNLTFKVYPWYSNEIYVQQYDSFYFPLSLPQSLSLSLSLALYPSLFTVISYFPFYISQLVWELWHLFYIILSVLLNFQQKSNKYHFIIELWREVVKERAREREKKRERERVREREREHDSKWI
jgi:hypothetical protein